MKILKDNHGRSYVQIELIDILDGIDVDKVENEKIRRDLSCFIPNEQSLEDKNI